MLISVYVYVFMNLDVSTFLFCDCITYTSIENDLIYSLLFLMCNVNIFFCLFIKYTGTNGKTVSFFIIYNITG